MRGVGLGLSLLLLGFVFGCKGEDDQSPEASTQEVTGVVPQDEQKSGTSPVLTEKMKQDFMLLEDANPSNVFPLSVSGVQFKPKEIQFFNIRPVPPESFQLESEVDPSGEPLYKGFKGEFQLDDPTKPAKIQLGEYTLYVMPGSIFVSLVNAAGVKLPVIINGKSQSPGPVSAETKQAVEDITDHGWVEVIPYDPEAFIACHQETEWPVYSIRNLTDGPMDIITRFELWHGEPLQLSPLKFTLEVAGGYVMIQAKKYCKCLSTYDGSHGYLVITVYPGGGNGYFAAEQAAEEAVKAGTVPPALPAPNGPPIRKRIDVECPRPKAPVSSHTPSTIATPAPSPIPTTTQDRCPTGVPCQEKKNDDNTRRRATTIGEILGPTSGMLAGVDPEPELVGLHEVGRHPCPHQVGGDISFLNDSGENIRYELGEQKPFTVSPDHLFLLPGQNGKLSVLFDCSDRSAGTKKASLPLIAHTVSNEGLIDKRVVKVSLLVVHPLNPLKKINPPINRAFIIPVHTSCHPMFKVPHSNTTNEPFITSWPTYVPRTPGTIKPNFTSAHFTKGQEPSDLSFNIDCHGVEVTRDTPPALIEGTIIFLDKVDYTDKDGKEGSIVLQETHVPVKFKITVE